MRSLIHALALSAAALLAAPVAAQSCSDLTVGGDGTPGTALTFDVAGAPANATTIVLLGFQEMAISGPFGLELGIVPALVIVGGSADGNGDFSASIDIPENIPGGFDAFAQSLSIGFSLPGPGGGGPPTDLFSFCSSDVEAFTVGTPPE